MDIPIGRTPPAGAGRVFGIMGGQLICGVRGAQRLSHRYWVLGIDGRIRSSGATVAEFSGRRLTKNNKVPR